jgi:hypothetical protein
MSYILQPTNHHIYFLWTFRDAQYTTWSMTMIYVTIFWELKSAACGMGGLLVAISVKFFPSWCACVMTVGKSLCFAFIRFGLLFTLLSMQKILANDGMNFDWLSLIFWKLIHYIGGKKGSIWCISLICKIGDVAYTLRCVYIHLYHLEKVASINLAQRFC